MRGKVKYFCELEPKIQYVILFLRFEYTCDSERIYGTRQGEICRGRIRASEMVWQPLALMLSLRHQNSRIFVLKFVHAQGLGQYLLSLT